MALEAKNIYFRYGKHQPWILEDQSIKVEKGQRLAIFAPQVSHLFIHPALNALGLDSHKNAQTSQDDKHLIDKKA